MSPFDLSVLFFLQIAFILAACRLCGWVYEKLGQSQVVSEMIAGVLLGPSLLGWLAPALSAAVFPPESKPVFFTFAQVGLALYMFLVGVEFNTGLIGKRLRSAAAVSAAGILAPFGLGGLLALRLAGDERLFAPGVTEPMAVLFMGAAMSITAFPMLARIISEQGLSATSLGTLALAAGAINDAAAWCVLAVVLAAFAGTPASAILAVGGGLAYALFCFIIIRPLLAPWGERAERAGRLGEGAFTGALLLAMLGAWFTDRIRVYAVFGAFIMGVAMPRGRFAEDLRAKVMPLTKTFLLPMFFVYSGLNTKIGLVDSPALWAVTGLALLAAMAGKWGACYAAARWSGEPHREAQAIGILMNARGLMELILLNIGLERGIIRPALFAILVMMAILTTLMATPLFRYCYGVRPPSTT